MKNTYTLLLILCIVAGLSSKAQYFEFVENKGQWNGKVKFQTNMGAGSLFLQQGGYKVLLNNTDDLAQISEYFGGHHLHGSDSAMPAKLNKNIPAKLVLRSHAYEVNFVGANMNAVAEPDKPLNTYNNYFIGGDSSKWAGHCRIFNAVNFRELYKGIDIRYYSDNGNLKYDLIAKPGADISKIALKIEGADKLYINKFGNLAIKTSVGEVYEASPFCYQLSQTGRSKVDAKFVLDNNILRFKIPSYDKNLTLVIDPALIFSTFVGSKSDSWGYTATYDNAGNFYAGGIAFQDGYPVSVGAYQTLFGAGDNSEGTGAGYDMAFIKFNPTGTQRVYATYLGGNGDEQPHSLIVDSRGDLIVAGRTTSSNYPVRSANFGPCGGFDIVISKFSPDGGALIASRKIGGGGADGVNIAPKYSNSFFGAETIRRNYGDDARSEVITDNSDNIYLASCTQSTNFPTTANAYRKAMAGRQDGVVIKTSPDMNTIIGSTYLGGDGDDAAFALAISPGGDVYTVGGTTSKDLKFNNSNINGPICFNTYKGGECDGMIAILDNSCNTLKKICYAGGAGNDNAYGVQFDKEGMPYIMGTTSVSLPVINSQFTSQQSGKQFISKLSPDLTQVIYSTNFGQGKSSPDISPTAFLVDVCERVYVSGWGGGANSRDGYPNAGTLGLVTTPNAISTITDGSDFYFFVLEKDAKTQLFGSFFGTDARFDPSVFGDHVDGGTSRFDRRGVIYQAICANCGKNGVFPTSPPNVWSPNNPSQFPAFCNEAAVKIALELSGVISSVRSSINGIPRDTTGCIPLTVDFEDTIGLGTSYVWDFGDGSAPVTTPTATISHTYNSVGNYRVMLVSIDPSKCNTSDTSYVTIRARDNKAILGLTATKLPPCSSLVYQFNNTSVPPAGFTFGPASFTWNFGDGSDPIVSNAATLTHPFPAAGVYRVVLTLNDTNFCNSPDSVVLQLRISENLVAQFSTPPTGCAPYNAVFTNTTLGGQNFIWDFGDGGTSSETDPVHLYPNPGTYTIKLKAFDNSTCNPVDSTQFTITVSPGPIAGFSFGPVPPKENTPTNFINTTTGGTRYSWDFGDGATLNTTRIDTPVNHIYNKTGTYKVCLTAFNEFGCSDDTCQFVDAVVLPLVDIPNAFTPNGDGVNDVVRVRGFGIDKMDWKIFNRWGQLVFETNSAAQVWDGKFKGVLQPQDVYTYVLSIVFSDQTNYQKKGDITLLR